MQVLKINMTTNKSSILITLLYRQVFSLLGLQLCRSFPMVSEGTQELMPPIAYDLSLTTSM